MNPWRERVGRWFTPIARRSPLSASQITILALAINLAGAVSLAMAGRQPELFLAVPVLLTIGGLLDALDGLVARIRGEAGPAGDLLDHFCDRVSDLSLVAGWCLGTGIRPTLAFPVLIAVMLHGYAGTQIEASYGTRSYEGVGRGEFVIAMVALPLFAWTLQRVGIIDRPFGRLSIPEWMTVLVGVGAILGAVQRIRIAMRTPDEP